MTDVIIQKSFSIKGSDLKRLYAEEREFKEDRERGAGFRITYMAHANGYVMCRRPGAMPFVMTEKEWRSLPKFPST